MKNLKALNTLSVLGLIAKDLRSLATMVKEAGDEYDAGNASTSEVAEYYFNLRTAYDDMDEAMKAIYHVHDRMNKGLIPELLQRDGLDAIRVPSVARSFSVVAKTSATMLDKGKGFEWLRSIGQGEIIQPTVNAGTLSALCRNLVLEQGIDPPPDVIKMSTYNTTSMVKYRPKGGAE